MLLNVEQRLVESGNFIGTSLLHLTSGLTESEQSVCLCVFVCVCLTQYEAAFFYKIGRKNYRENLRLPEVPIKT